MTGAGTLALDPVPSAPGAARRWLREQLDALGLAAHADVALLLVSEAVTNAVLHARSSLEVRVEPRGRGVRVEVRDGSPALPARRRLSARATTGRGVALLESLADHWGWERDGAGKTVWFELDRPRDSWPVAELEAVSL
jgi:anti-sigma regulatory factor (Ser/Thr protein kinase)